MTSPTLRLWRTYRLLPCGDAFSCHLQAFSASKRVAGNRPPHRLWAIPRVRIPLGVFNHRRVGIPHGDAPTEAGVHEGVGVGESPAGWWGRPARSHTSLRNHPSDRGWTSNTVRNATASPSGDSTASLSGSIRVTPATDGWQVAGSAAVKAARSLTQPRSATSKRASETA